MAERQVVRLQKGILPTYMFDTNVFNRILDGAIPLHTFAGLVEAYATHIQLDEINNTNNSERRAALIEVFNHVVAGTEPTGSFVLGVSRLGKARLGGERVVPTASAVHGVWKYGHLILYVFVAAVAARFANLALRRSRIRESVP